MTTRPPIYLASNSPRRRDLLKQVGIPFEVLQLRTDPRRPLDVDETVLPGEVPVDYVVRVSRAKALAGLAAIEFLRDVDARVLAADTTVVLDDRIFGKPMDREEAATMLRQLSGRRHRVLSAVTAADGERIESRLSETEVSFVPLSEGRIHRYVMSNEPHDKAGAYGIQGLAGAFVQRIDGSYSGVVGLPLAETVELLQLFGHQAP